MGYHFCIGVRDKLVPLGLEFLPQFSVVFNDTVLDDGYPSMGVAVRMGIILLRFTMGSPSSMANP
jgi:hypothetical protein